MTELYAQAKSNMFMNGILSSANTDPSFTLSVQTPAGLVEQPAITSISHVYFVAFQDRLGTNIGKLKKE